MRQAGMQKTMTRSNFNTPQPRGSKQGHQRLFMTVPHCWMHSQCSLYHHCWSSSCTEAHGDHGMLGRGAKGFCQATNTAAQALSTTYAWWWCKLGLLTINKERTLALGGARHARQGARASARLCASTPFTAALPHTRCAVSSRRCSVVKLGSGSSCITKAACPGCPMPCLMNSGSNLHRNM